MGIWGNWVVGVSKGGFQMWPLSEVGPVKFEKERRGRKISRGFNTPLKITFRN
jgi:hypothetical protein